MKKLDLKTLYRYDKSKKLYYIDIQLDFYRDVYSDWDYSPYINRELDEDLLDYLMSCSYEIPLKRNLVIVFHLPLKIKAIEREKKSILGIQNYFAYKIRKAKIEKFGLFKNTLVYLLIGTLLLVGAYMMQSVITNEFLTKIVPEGLLIGAWVVFWEIFSIWFFKINELSNRIKHYKRLKNIPIMYHYE